MQDSDALTRFYEEAYSQRSEQASRYSRWRALGAVGKADHVIELCRRAGLASSTLLDVGCGDGALLSELHRRRFGDRFVGVEIAGAAVEIARARPEIDAVELFDGATLPFAAGSFDLGVLSHVLEHVVDPPALLREVARTARAVVVEVPLEANWSARRASRRAQAAEVGHLQRLGRAQARAIVAAAGLEIVAELEDPLPLRAHSFFADTRRARVAATARWALRSGVHGLAPAVARRAFTLHYACACRPPGA